MSVVRPAATESRPLRRKRNTASVRGRRSEPILVPKLRIRLADFPYSHCSIGQRLLTSETCCGRGYDRRHEPDSLCGRRIFKGRRGRTGRRTNGGALPGPRASRRLDRFQARAETPVNKRRQLLPGPSPTSPSSSPVVADSYAGSMMSVREYRPDSLSRTPAEKSGHVPFRIDSPACDCR